jgi:hypothetical protein
MIYYVWSLDSFFGCLLQVVNTLNTRNLAVNDKELGRAYYY